MNAIDTLKETPTMLWNHDCGYDDIPLPPNLVQNAILELADRIEKLEAATNINQPPSAVAAEKFDIDLRVTERGFCIGEFNDRYGLNCSIQKSSLAFENCIWLGVHEMRMHLTQAMAAALIPLLSTFVETGALSQTKEEKA